ncbi:hypothetical protein NFHSH190041_06800 [Shewanella sp. NFH-SH190041]|uniref:hypothetical protein n=1 Tax=Shewanella sp. NFH-SH190041 TaxID=2950245 RepID=UPI0021C3612D|nr:hypothetical protein [Shewanella sp. NFH-SH190041]BDM63228.1 hypothetical protein NFHSH190041_06800 [Shewanella sp. NFH-SH190041]
MTAPDKAQLIELYEFARKRVVQSMELRHCPHAGFYNPTDEQCLFCHQGMECVWMNHNDELVSLADKSVEELKQQLLIAVDFIDSSLTPYHLSRRQCQCENCVWLRKVQAVLGDN